MSRTSMKMVDSFTDKHFFLSNFYPVDVQYEGIVYPSSEHAYMSAKTLDPELKEKIRMATTPGKAKRIGRSVELREDWEDIKVSVMIAVIRRKFSAKYRPELCRMLVETGNAVLIEGNTWGDTFWGTCNGKGKNWLGRILMARREVLKRIFNKP